MFYIIKTSVVYSIIPIYLESSFISKILTIIDFIILNQLLFR